MSNTLTTGQVEVGQSANGEIDRYGNHDWFAVTFEAGKSYRIDVASLESDATVDHPYVRGVFGAGGNFFDGSYNVSASRAKCRPRCASSTGCPRRCRMRPAIRGGHLDSDASRDGSRSTR